MRIHNNLSQVNLSFFCYLLCCIMLVSAVLANVGLPDVGNFRICSCVCVSERKRHAEMNRNYLCGNSKVWA